MKILKVLFNILSLLIIVVVAYLGVINAGTMINFVLKGSVGVNAATTHVSLVYVIFATLIAGIIAGAFWSMSFYLTTKDAIKGYKRQLEKKSVTAESDSSRVKVLESKIEVLEKALASALEKNKNN